MKKNPVEKVLKQDFAFLNKDVIKELKLIGLDNKNVAQFCCNNGRELLSIVNSGAKSGTGFDIAKNFIKEANHLAKVANLNCQFICTNIYDIDNKFTKSFDLLFISIGSLCWFKDLNIFFEKASMVLKNNGTLLINDNHPFTNLLAMQGDQEYDKNNPEKFAFSYFKMDPWIENNGMDYIGNTTYRSKTFYSYSHTLSEIINSIIKHNMIIVKIYEFDYSLYGFKDLNKRKIPLSYL